MNILITLAIFATFNLTYGKVEADNSIARFSENSPAQMAGLEVGDEIVAIDGEVIESFQDIGSRVLMYPGKQINVTIERDGSTEVVPLTIGEVLETDRFGNESRIGRIGIYSGEPKVSAVGPVEAVTLAGAQSWGLVEMMVTGIKQIEKAAPDAFVVDTTGNWVRAKDAKLPE